MKQRKDEPYRGVGYYPEVKLTPEEIRIREKEQKSKKTGGSRARLLATAACSVVFVVSAVLLLQYFSEIQRAKTATADLRAIYQNDGGVETTATVQASATVSATFAPTPTPTAAPAAAVAAQSTAQSFASLWPTSYASNPELRISDTFQKLRQQNKDVVGWLSIDGVLDEPVLQRDNSYYLTHDSTGAKNKTGALFLDESCNLRKLSPHLLIHGHNMKEGAMFGSLKKYKVKDAEFYKSHPYVTFNTLYEDAKYVIFAVTEVSISSSDHQYLPFWAYESFSSEAEFDSYVNRLREYSHFQTSVDVQPGDRLLTLATCSGTNENTRLLVAARMLRPDEDAIALSRGIYSTTAQ